MMSELLPLTRLIITEGAKVGSTSKNKCTWSGIISNAISLQSCSVHNSKIICCNRCFTSPTNTGFLRFGRPVQRPTPIRKTKTELFGKKKRHTRKHLAAVDQNKQVLVLSQAREGKLHDKKFRIGRKANRKYTCGDSS